MQGPRSGREGGPRSGPEKLSSAPRSSSSIIWRGKHHEKYLLKGEFKIQILQNSKWSNDEFNREAVVIAAVVAAVWVILLRRERVPQHTSILTGQVYYNEIIEHNNVAYFRKCYQSATSSIMAQFRT